MKDLSHQVLRKIQYSFQKESSLEHEGVDSIPYSYSSGSYIETQAAWHLNHSDLQGC